VKFFNRIKALRENRTQQLLIFEFLKIKSLLELADSLPLSNLLIKLDFINLENEKIEILNIYKRKCRNELYFLLCFIAILLTAIVIDL
jgi:hypothetical protein